MVAIIALIGAFAIPNLSSYMKISLGSAAREMSSTIKETYNASVLTGRVYRLAYDFKSNSYWVEAGSSGSLLDTKETIERDERRSRFSSKEDKPAPKSDFAPDKSITRGKTALPRGVVFEDILTEQSPDPVTEGTVYTHFFPHGISEQTVIHLKDTSEHHATLAISPVIGRTRVIDRYVRKPAPGSDEDESR